MARKGVLTVISGFSGAGKGTVMKALLKKYPNYMLSISATTREPREGEEDGREYFFLTKEKFESMIESDSFIEWANYVDNYYGTPREYVEKQLEDGKDVILEIEMQGALNVKKSYPDALLLFITPNSFNELVSRLKGRGTEDDETIEKRIRRCYEESSVVDNYDFLVINDKVDNCVEQINSIIQNEHRKPLYNKDLTEEFRSNSKDFSISQYSDN